MVTIGHKISVSLTSSLEVSCSTFVVPFFTGGEALRMDLAEALSSLLGWKNE